MQDDESIFFQIRCRPALVPDDDTLAEPVGWIGSSPEVAERFGLKRPPCRQQ
jgi:hypothetical protein